MATRRKIEVAVPSMGEWMAQQVFNIDPVRRAAAAEIQTRWGFGRDYSHARAIRILTRENSESLVGAKLLADDFVTQFGLTGDKITAISGVAGHWFPTAVEYCSHMQGSRACTREAIPGTGLCARHGGQWMTEQDREHLSREIFERLNGLTSMALRVIEDLLDHGRSEKVRLDAAIAVLDRTGMGPSATLHVESDGHAASDMITDRLNRLAAAAAAQTDEDIIDAELVDDGSEQLALIPADQFEPEPAPAPAPEAESA